MIKGLKESTTEGQLLDGLIAFGPIKEIRLVKDRVRPRTRNRTRTPKPNDWSRIGCMHSHHALDAPLHHPSTPLHRALTTSNASTSAARPSPAATLRCAHTHRPLCRVVRSQATKVSRGFAFVEFHALADARSVIESTEPLIVDEAALKVLIPTFWR